MSNTSLQTNSYHEAGLRAGTRSGRTSQFHNFCGTLDLSNDGPHSISRGKSLLIRCCDVQTKDSVVLFLSDVRVLSHRSISSNDSAVQTPDPRLTIAERVSFSIGCTRHQAVQHAVNIDSRRPLVPTQALPSVTLILSHLTLCQHIESDVVASAALHAFCINSLSH